MDEAMFAINMSLVCRRAEEGAAGGGRGAGVRGRGAREPARWQQLGLCHAVTHAHISGSLGLLPCYTRMMHARNLVTLSQVLF